MNLQEVDFHNLIEQLVSEFEPVAREQGITLLQELSPEPVIISMDVEQMVRAIDNLLMNATKFSLLPGEVKIGLITGEKFIQLSIENQGQPITKEQEELLFQRFYRTEPKRSDMYMPPGYGLGLSIARNIIELHGGRIWLDHQQGEYRFCIEMKRPMHANAVQQEIRQ